MKHHSLDLLYPPLTFTTINWLISESSAYELKSIDISNKYLVSLDVVCSLTYPIKNTYITAGVSYITEGNGKCKLPKTDLNTIFSIATAQAHVLFIVKVYDQIDGVAIGSSLAPVLANLFLG